MEPLISFYAKTLHEKHITVDFIWNTDETPPLNKSTSTEVVMPAKSILHPARVDSFKMDSYYFNLDNRPVEAETIQRTSI